MEDATPQVGDTSLVCPFPSAASVSDFDVLLAHLCGQLCHFLSMRQKMMDLYPFIQGLLVGVFFSSTLGFLPKTILLKMESDCLSVEVNSGHGRASFLSGVFCSGFFSQYSRFPSLGCSLENEV